MVIRACALIGVFFGNQVVAFRKATSFQTSSLQQPALDADEPSPLVAYRQAHSGDPPSSAEQERIAKITCGDMPMALAAAVLQAEETLRESCRDGRCYLAVWTGQRTIDELDEAAANLNDLFMAADRRECLAETLADSVVRERVSQLRNLWGWMLEGSSTHRATTTFSVRERLEQSHALLARWRGRLLTEAGSTLDRRRIFPRNIEDVEACPEPCISCSHSHNSIFEGTERLAFKCILPRGASLPTLSDLSCEEPQPRSGIAGQLHGQTKSWCDVRSWRLAAEQSVEMAVDIACSAEIIFGPLRHGREMEDQEREGCLAVQRGTMRAEGPAAQAYQDHKTADGVAADAELSAFRIFMHLGMAEGVADLRLAARGNTPQ